MFRIKRYFLSLMAQINDTRIPTYPGSSEITQRKCAPCFYRHYAAFRRSSITAHWSLTWHWTSWSNRGVTGSGRSCTVSGREVSGTPPVRFTRRLSLLQTWGRRKLRWAKSLFIVFCCALQMKKETKRESDDNATGVRSIWIEIAISSRANQCFTATRLQAEYLI